MMHSSMLKFKTVLLVLISILCLSNVQAQFGAIELPEDIVKVKFSIEQKGEDVTVVADVTTKKGWHINASKLPAGSFGIPTTFELNKSKDFKLVGGIIEPKPIEHYDKMADETLVYHEGSFKIRRKIKVLSTSDFVLKGSFNYQTCNEVKCLPDYTYEFSLNVKGVEKLAENVDTEEVDETVISDTADTALADTSDKVTSEAAAIAKKPVEEEQKSNWVIFLLAFGSGLIALVTPCVFPMIPMTVSFFTKGGTNRKKGLRDAIIYGLCILGIYTGIGLIVKLTGTGDYLNNISTNPVLNIIFFLIFFIFALSFLGAFEIRMPSKLVNSADAKADKGGFIGIFFMALVLVLVSFSCTGPILGSLLISASTEGGNAILAGMFGFGLALGLPFAVFAAFPSLMESLPKSGGWLNTVKVVLGLFELAFAFKFLSNADMALQAHLLERELFLAIWIAVFGVMALNLFGIVLFPHDDKPERIGVGRGVFGTFVLMFVIYMIPGLFGHPLKIISAFPPPLHYSEAPNGFMGGGNNMHVNSTDEKLTYIEGTHLGPQGIYVFHDLDKAKAYAKEVGKPLFVDFTGHNCVNCRKMEMSVWGEPGILPMLRNDYVIASLYVDERTPLPKEEHKTVTYPDGSKREIKTVGQKWMAEQIISYHIASQPYYRVLTPEGEDVEEIGSASYETHRDPKEFQKWLESGLKLTGKK